MLSCIKYVTYIHKFVLCSIALSVSCQHRKCQFISGNSLKEHIWNLYDLFTEYFSDRGELSFDWVFLENFTSFLELFMSENWIFFLYICYCLHTFQILFLLKFKNIYNDIQNMMISWYNLLFSTFVLGWGELIHGMARVSWEPTLYLNNQE